MSWQKVVLITLYAVSVVLVWGQVDKPREPISPGLALWMTLWTAGLTAMVVYA
jgi:hypothetical protein